VVAATLLAVLAPKNSFLLLYGTAVAGMFYVWIVILLTHLRFRKSIDPEQQARLPLKIHCHPWATIAALLAMSAIAVSTFWVSGLQYTVPTFIALLGVISLIYFVMRRRAARSS
jgi:L-asparagine transporter-like permease